MGMGMYRLPYMDMELRVLIGERLVHGHTPLVHRHVLSYAAVSLYMDQCHMSIVKFLFFLDYLFSGHIKAAYRQIGGFTCNIWYYIYIDPNSVIDLPCIYD